MILARLRTIADVVRMEWNLPRRYRGVALPTFRERIVARLRWEWKRRRDGARLERSRRAHGLPADWWSARR